MNSNSNIKNRSHDVLHILSGTIISIAVTLVLILLFAILIRFVNVSDGLIFPVNQVIKVISLIIGLNIVLKKNKTKGFLKGIVLGILYFVISYIVFSLLQRDFTFDIKNFYDFLLTSLMGGLLGIIVINIIKK